MKENKFLKNNSEGAKAEPSWQLFIEQFKEQYQTTQEAKHLIELHPKRQIVNKYHEMDWLPVGIKHCNNDLCTVITMLLTIRNNLFHGGKHGDIDLDNEERNIELLSIGKIILDQLA